MGRGVFAGENKPPAGVWRPLLGPYKRGGKKTPALIIRGGKKRGDIKPRGGKKIQGGGGGKKRGGEKPRKKKARANRGGNIKKKRECSVGENKGGEKRPTGGGRKKRPEEGFNTGGYVERTSSSEEGE